MATQKPRITVTLEPHTYEVLSQLAELQGGSKAGIISELLETVVPVFERTCYVIQMAQQASNGVNDEIRASMERSEAKLQVIMNEALGQLDIFETDASRAMSAASGVTSGLRAAGAGGGAGCDPLPPHSNTGVTPTPRRKSPKKSATKRKR